MHHAYIVTGALTDERTVTLDEALPVRGGKVRLIVEVIPPDSGPSYAEVTAAIRHRQRQRGHVAPSRAEVDAALQAERASWGD